MRVVSGGGGGGVGGGGSGGAEVWTGGSDMLISLDTRGREVRWGLALGRGTAGEEAREGAKV